MGREIERKYLLANDGWRGLVQGVPIRQGYLSADKDCTVRVRIAGDRAFLTVKGAAVGASRPEFEYPIPAEDARAILGNLAKRPLVEKIRHVIPYAGMTWEVDEFCGDNRGLILAEIELESEDQDFALPPWIGKEVTADPRYYNANLVRNPFTRW